MNPLDPSTDPTVCDRQCRHRWRSRLLPAIVVTGLVVGGFASPDAFALEPRGSLRNPSDDPSLGEASVHERFGATLALDGGRLAVSAMASVQDLSRKYGHVSVFERGPAGWVRIARVDPPIPQDHAMFGAGLALDGPQLVVGAPLFKIGETFNAGMVTLFAFDGATFVPQQVFTAPPASGLHVFGLTLALDGDTLVIGARRDDAASMPEAGVALVYRKVGDSWVHRQTLASMQPREYDGFGSALYLDDGLLLVGASRESPRGGAYAYEQDQGQWVLRQRFEPPGSSTAGGFGANLAADARRVLVGAPDFSQGGVGAVFEWRREGAGWTAGRTFSLQGQSGLRGFGWRLARHGGRWFVGALRGVDAHTVDRVELFGYVESGNELTLERQIGIANENEDGFGLTALAVNAQAVFVGLPESRVTPWSEAGEVRVVPLQSGTTEVSLSSGATAAGEAFGAAIAANTKWLAIGAPGERRNTAQRGGVYVYPRIDGPPDPTVAPLSVPDLVWRDEFGVSVAFSGDTLLVGAQGWEHSGSVHAFEHDGFTWRRVMSWRPATSRFARFGNRLDADERTFAANSPWDDGGRGAVYIVERSGAAWADPVMLQFDQTAPQERRGVDLDLQGDTLVASTQGFTIGEWMQPITSDGAAHVFARGAAGWSQVARLTRPYSSAGDAQFGASIALEGDILAVGAPLLGEVHVYRRTGGVWAWSSRIDGRGAAWGGFGTRVRIVDGDLWVASPATEELLRYRPRDGAWRVLQRIAELEGRRSNSFGASFAVAGGRVFVGEPAAGGHHPRVWSAGRVWIDEPTLFGDGLEP
jgi:hypothetical protein